MGESQGPICMLDRTTKRRIGPTPIGAKIHDLPWVVEPDKIQLFDPGDVITWDLKGLWEAIPGIKQVTLIFKCGREAPTPPYDPSRGPFGEVLVDLKNLVAVGSRPDGIEDCYCYNIEIAHESGQSWSLFPIDPQIDNLPPIPPPHEPFPEPPPRRKRPHRP